MADSIQSVAIFGTGLIGASVGLALRAQGFTGSIVGWDRSSSEAEIARERGAIDSIAAEPLRAAQQCDCILLATPVFGILEWMERLAPVLRKGQLVTDVGSTKQAICDQAAHVFSSADGAQFLPGHPMAGKEVHGAAHADARLFRAAVWLFTPGSSQRDGECAAEWRAWVERFGSRILVLNPARHDEVCAWASHLPQMLGTALAALLEDTFPDTDENLKNNAGDLRAIGGRAMHEMTRLGASPFSMWRDIAQSNEEPIAAALLALEQRLALIRENLKQPELRDQFERANRFRSRF
ncbi:MAG: prephenate dehydrogenase/arogenate dehydrogenase family protein [Acidobacteriaceae bacterium]